MREALLSNELDDRYRVHQKIHTSLLQLNNGNETAAVTNTELFRASVSKEVKMRVDSPGCHSKPGLDLDSKAVFPSAIPIITCLFDVRDTASPPTVYSSLQPTSRSKMISCKRKASGSDNSVNSEVIPSGSFPVLIGHGEESGRGSGKVHEKRETGTNIFTAESSLDADRNQILDGPKYVPVCGGRYPHQLASVSQQLATSSVSASVSQQLASASCGELRSWEGVRCTLQAQGMKIRPPEHDLTDLTGSTVAYCWGAVGWAIGKVLSPVGGRVIATCTCTPADAYGASHSNERTTILPTTTTWVCSFFEGRNAAAKQEQAQAVVTKTRTLTLDPSMYVSSAFRLGSKRKRRKCIIPSEQPVASTRGKTDNVGSNTKKVSRKQMYRGRRCRRRRGNNKREIVANADTTTAAGDDEVDDDDDDDAFVEVVPAQSWAIFDSTSTTTSTYSTASTHEQACRSGLQAQQQDTVDTSSFSLLFPAAAAFATPPAMSMVTNPQYRSKSRPQEEDKDSSIIVTGAAVGNIDIDIPAAVVTPERVSSTCGTGSVATTDFENKPTASAAPRHLYTGTGTGISNDSTRAATTSYHSCSPEDAPPLPVHCLTSAGRGANKKERFLFVDRKLGAAANSRERNTDMVSGGHEIQPRSALDIATLLKEDLRAAAISAPIGVVVRKTGTGTAAGRGDCAISSISGANKRKCQKPTTIGGSEKAFDDTFKKWRKQVVDAYRNGEPCPSLEFPSVAVPGAIGAAGGRRRRTAGEKQQQQQRQRVGEEVKVATIRSSTRARRCSSSSSFAPPFSSTLKKAVTEEVANDDYDDLELRVDTNLPKTSRPRPYPTSYCIAMATSPGISILSPTPLPASPASFLLVPPVAVGNNDHEDTDTLAGGREATSTVASLLLNAVSSYHVEEDVVPGESDGGIIEDLDLRHNWNMAALTMLEEEEGHCEPACGVVSTLSEEPLMLPVSGTSRQIISCSSSNSSSIGMNAAYQGGGSGIDAVDPSCSYYDTADIMSPCLSSSDIDILSNDVDMMELPGDDDGGYAEGCGLSSSSSSSSFPGSLPPDKDAGDINDGRDCGSNASVVEANTAAGVVEISGAAPSVSAGALKAPDAEASSIEDPDVNADAEALAIKTTTCVLMAEASGDIEAVVSAVNAAPDASNVSTIPAVEAGLEAVVSAVNAAPDASNVSAIPAVEAGLEAVASAVNAAPDASNVSAIPAVEAGLEAKVKGATGNNSIETPIINANTEVPEVIANAEVPAVSANAEVPDVEAALKAAGGTDANCDKAPTIDANTEVPDVYANTEIPAVDAGLEDDVKVAGTEGNGNNIGKDISVELTNAKTSRVEAPTVSTSDLRNSSSHVDYEAVADARSIKAPVVKADIEASYAEVPAVSANTETPEIEADVEAAVKTAGTDASYDKAPTIDANTEIPAGSANTEVHEIEAALMADGTVASYAKAPTIGDNTEIPAVEADVEVSKLTNSSEASDSNVGALAEPPGPGTAVVEAFAGTCAGASALKASAIDTYVDNGDDADIDIEELELYDCDDDVLNAILELTPDAYQPSCKYDDDESVVNCDYDAEYAEYDRRAEYAENDKDGDDNDETGLGVDGYGYDVQDGGDYTETGLVLDDCSQLARDDSDTEVVSGYSYDRTYDDDHGADALLRDCEVLSLTGSGLVMSPDDEDGVRGGQEGDDAALIFGGNDDDIDCFWNKACEVISSPCVK